MGFGQGGMQRVKSVKINRAQLNNRKRKEYFKNPTGHQKIYSDFIDHIEMSPEEFEIFKEEIILKK
jgi:hypothetical protein